MRPRIGAMSRRVELRNFTTVQDSFGELIRTWSTFATVWASILPLSGREFLAAQQVNAEDIRKIVIRYRTDVNVVTRIKSGTSEYDIQSVANLEDRNTWLELICKLIKPGV
jgi:SPP1 family predicted phage head-tail adaptor